MFILKGDKKDGQKDLTVPLGNRNRMISESENDQMKSVHEVCQEYGLTRKTLYYYDQIGLLKPTHRIGTQNAKFYGPKALKRLQKIMQYQSLGVSLKNIQRLLEEDDKEEIIIQETIIQMEDSVQELNSKITNAKQYLKEKKQNEKDR